MSDCLCFKDYTDVEGTSISSDTLSIVIESYGAGGGAVLPTVYILADGDPGHELSVQSADGAWWDIHPDQVTLEAAGAPEDQSQDCAPAMNVVLGYTDVTNDCKLQLLERQYAFVTTVTKTFDPRNDYPYLNLSILGRGRGISRIFVPLLNTTGGPFQVTFGDNQTRLLLRDFAVVAESPTEASQWPYPGNGTGLYFRFAVGQGPGKFRGAIIEHVSILNDGVTTKLCETCDPVSLGFFSVGIDVTGCNYPYFHDVTINGCEGAGAIVDRSDSDPAYAMQTAVVVNDCYDPKLADCRFWHGQVAVSYQNNAHGEDPPANVQAFQMIGCELNGFQTGLKFSNNGIEFPHVVIAGNEGTFRDVGFDISDPFKIMLTNNQFSSDGDGTYTINGGVYYDMWFKHANVVTIVGSGFNTKADPDRVCIYIDAVTDTAGDNTHGASHFLVAENQFGDQVGGSPFATYAVELTTGAEDIQIGHNDYAGTFGIESGGTFVPGPLIYDASGAAIIWNASVSQAATITSEVQPMRPGSYPISGGPFAELYQNVLAGGLANDSIGSLQLAGNDAAGTKNTFASIAGQVQSAAAGAVAGILNISVAIGGALTKVMGFTPPGISIGATGITSVTPAVDNAITLGSSAQRWSQSYAVARYFSGGVFDSTGAGSPEGVVTAPVGSTYRNTGGGIAANIFWVKQTGFGNTGWVGK